SRSVTVALSSCSFFLPSHRPHRPLHSFPTRRSSDLASFFTGAVTLSGGAGNDTLIGTAGNDSLDGGAGTDVVSASANVNFTLAKDRKSTRLNSSHRTISYAVFCLKKKKKQKNYKHTI